MKKIILQRKSFTAVAIVLVMLLMASCGSNDDGSSQQAGGGITGTGISTGVITGFGSVFVNGFEYEIEGAEKKISGNIASETEFRVGMKVEMEIEDGKVVRIEYEPEAKGVITGIDTANRSINILGQNVLIDSSTIFEGSASLTSIKVGDIVEISGFTDADGNIRVTFIKLEDENETEFELKGEISNLDDAAKTFSISSLIVDYSAVAILPALSNGKFVEVKGTLNADKTILKASEISIEDRAFSGEVNKEFEVEGFIIEINPASGVNFIVNGISVQITANTIFENGDAANISKNIKVEVEGTTNDAGILIAKKIQFKFSTDGGTTDGNKEIEMEAKVDENGVDLNNSTIKVMGITLNLDKNTIFKDDRDEKRDFKLEDIADGDFLEIGGFVGGAGKVTATKIKRDDGKDNEVILKGLVEAKDQTQNSITILGVIIDTAAAELKDRNELAISKDAFFTQITTGTTRVKAKGTLNTEGKIIAEEAELED